jgi:hypothetical protein
VHTQALDGALDVCVTSHNLKQFIDKNVGQDVSLQENNNYKYQPNCVLRNLKVSSEVRAHLNTKSPFWAQANNIQRAFI